MATRKRYTPLGFLLGISRRKSRKGKTKFTLLFILGALVAAFHNGVPSPDQVQQFIAENVMLSDVKVTDGDTLHIKGQAFRLFGIDAPEHDQPCYDANSKPWACGAAARTALWKMTNGRQIRCNVTDKDKYGRSVAICYAGNIELNREMARQGMAIAYRQYSIRYVADEQAAKTAKVGIWQGKFMEPGDWRKRH